MAEDKQDLQPLREIDPSLTQCLEIVQGDLRLEGDFDEHVKGCHLACPTNFLVEDPQVGFNMVFDSDPFMQFLDSVSLDRWIKIFIHSLVFLMNASCFLII